MVDYAVDQPQEEYMPQRYVIDDLASVVEDADGGLIVTRPNMYGQATSHHIKSPYTPLEVAVWLANRIQRKPNPMVQDTFPAMNKEDREFLMTGITPEEWNRIFPQGPEEECRKLGRRIE